MAYITVKILSALLRGLKNNGYFYCLNCLHLFRTKGKLESHDQECENKGFCNVVMPSGGTKILEVNQYCKSEKRKTKKNRIYYL